MTPLETTDDVLTRRHERLANILNYTGEDRERFMERMAERAWRNPTEPYHYAVPGTLVEVFYRMDLDFTALLCDIVSFFDDNHPSDEDGPTYVIEAIAIDSHAEEKLDLVKAVFGDGEKKSTSYLRATVVWNEAT